jgi:hypothetical protein
MPPFAAAPAPASPPTQSPFSNVPIGSPPQTAQEPSPQPPETSGAAAFPFAGLSVSSADSGAQPLSQSAFGGGGLGLERHQPAARSGNSPLDWASFVLAFVAPPIGLVAGIIALIVGSRTRGFTAGIAKVAVAIAIVLSIALTVGYVVVSKINSDQAAHDAIAASSQAWCTKLKSNPATLASNTYGWPSPGNTIPASITSMQSYVDYWASLEKIAPAGIKSGTTQIESSAKSIADAVQKTQTLDDASNVSTMQAAVANSGVSQWVTQYCK